MRSWLQSPSPAGASKGAGLVAMICGILVGGLGVIVMFGWHTQNDALTRVYPDFSPMQYFTATCIVLCSAGLVTFVAGLPRIFSMLSGGVVGIAGLLLCIEYLTGAKLGFDQLLVYLPAMPGKISIRASPPTSVCFLLCGTAIALLGVGGFRAFRRPAIWLLASLALALCLMAVCGHLTGLAGTYMWGPFAGMALHTAVGIAILSTGLLATLRMDGRRFLDDPWLPVPVAVVTITATLVLWQALLADRYITMRAKSNLVAQEIKAGALIHMDGPFRALDRMRLRWERRGGMPYEEWKSDALAYLHDERVFQAIEWADASLHVRWVMPESDSPMVAGLDLTSGKHWNATKSLEWARENRALVVSPSVPLKQGGQGFIAFYPLFPGGKFDGFLIGVFRLHDLMQLLLDERSFEDFSISVFEGQDLIYGPAVNPAKDDSINAEAVVDFHDHSWRFVVLPKSEFLTAGERQLPRVVLLLGILCAGALTTAVRTLQLKTRQTHDIQRANRELETEISGRKRIEARLRESEERLRLVLDSATGVSVISADTTGVITYFSKGAEKILGYAADEMVGKVTPAVFHDEGEVVQRGEELSSELGRTVAGFDVFVSIPLLRGSETREWTYVCKDGARRTVELTVTVSRDAEDGVIGFLGTAIDITERKEMEQAIRESLREKAVAQSLLEEAGQIARLGHWELPLDGRGPSWSDVTCAIHEEPPGTSVSLDKAVAYYHPDERQKIHDLLEEVKKTGEAFDFEARLITAGKREIWVHTRGVPVRDENGAIVAFRGVIQDVDESRRAAALLEQRNRQLEVARAQAEAHARAKSEFLANMSHEIRTPLNAIIGMSDLLTDSKLPAHERELIETIRTSGDMLLGLINDILDFSKIESGQLDLERIPVNLRECVESALDLFAGQAVKKGLELLHWIDPAVPPTILGDVTRLRQILVNLVGNAIKFTNEGEIFVKVLSRAGEDGTGTLLVSVQDTGIGIPADRMDRLFQAFSQVDASTTRRYGGTGLGLVISHRLVELMHGHIRVESKVGKGTTFQFEIPIEAVDAPILEGPQKSGARSLKGLR
ncbi:MAG: ATP-binding protein, partial [Chthoniobacterales bacterium]